MSVPSFEEETSQQTHPQPCEEYASGFGNVGMEEPGVFINQSLRTGGNQFNTYTTDKSPVTAPNRQNWEQSPHRFYDGICQKNIVLATVIDISKQTEN